MDTILLKILVVLLQLTRLTFSNPCGPRTQRLMSNEIRISNRCPYPIWPAILSYSKSELLENGGFELKSWTTQVFHVSRNWSGKIWGRTGCQYSEDGCLFICETGDCGKGLCCQNSTGISPIKTAEIAFGSELNPDDCLDRYSISVADGYNLQMQIRPIEGGFIKMTNKRFDCNLAGCFKDLNTVCPEEFAFRNRRGGVKVGCRNPCGKFGSGSEYENKTEYESCIRYRGSVDFFSIVSESCPDVLVYDNHVCEGVVYTCRKNEDGFSAYDVIFCP